ncbi:MAG: FimB/Mfa2 family fimbrial subunit [Rikenellaceae bacterium]|nr:FimB/Mfa2 family fimbrial subunit [Rikenellaceae bacterium]
MRKAGHIPFLLWALVVWLSGCIGEKNSRDCERTLELFLYSQTACQSEPEYPDRIEELLICLFDGNGVLTQIFSRGPITLDPEYRESLTVTRTGTYTVSVWSGIEPSTFALFEPIPGVTTREEVFLRVLRQERYTTLDRDTFLYYGESAPIPVVDRSIEPITVSVNLQQITNRLTVRIEGIPAEMVESTEVYVESDNGTMALDSRLLEDEILVYYPYERENGQEIQAEFTLLKLDAEHTNLISIRNQREEEFLYRGDLLEELILQNPQLNLECDHDFEITFTVGPGEEPGTYMILRVRVNDWLVHSYDWDAD